MFVQNKYYAWYLGLINKATTRNWSKNQLLAMLNGIISYQNQYSPRWYARHPIWCI